MFWIGNKTHLDSILKNNEGKYQYVNPLRKNKIGSFSRSFRLCLVLENFEGKREGKKVKRKGRRKEKMKENKKWS